MEPAAMEISVNGENQTVDDGLTVSGLLDQLSMGAAPGIAVAVDGAVVPRSAWGATSMNPGSAITIIRATQGG